MKLKVLFDKGAAQHLYERPLSDDQALAIQADGRVLLAATVNDTEELEWWLKAFGDQVEIVSPAPLRRKFANLADSLARLYS